MVLISWSAFDRAYNRFTLLKKKKSDICFTQSSKKLECTKSQARKTRQKTKKTVIQQA